MRVCVCARFVRLCVCVCVCVCVCGLCVCVCCDLCGLVCVNNKVKLKVTKSQSGPDI